MEKLFGFFVYNKIPYFHSLHLFSLIIQGNMILVDVLGIRGSVNVTDKLIEDLPNALLFIFVINGGSAGGMQNDRVFIQLSNLILIIFYQNKQKLNKNILLFFLCTCSCYSFFENFSVYLFSI